MPSLQSERVQPDLPFVPPLLRRLPLKRVGADAAYLAIALSCPARSSIPR